MKKQYCGIVSLIGKPNVGKSTLLNNIMKTKLAAVSSKPQTTRTSIKGIYTENNYQIIFMDTPGKIVPKYLLQQFYLEKIKQAIQSADLILYLIDAEENKIILHLESASKLAKEKAVILVLNKIDLLTINQIKELGNLLSKENIFKDIVFISAKRNANLENLLKKVKKHLPAGKFLYADDVISDSNDRFFTKEIIREKILENYFQEIPYAVFVKVEEFKEKYQVVYIYAIIYVEKKQQKKILIGQKGEKIKQLNIKIREELEKVFEKKIYLELWVKVLNNWGKNKSFLTRNLV